MTTVNLVEVRRRLPHGSLSRIADTVGVSVRIVGDVFKYGWYPQYHNQVVEAALSIIDETIIDPDVVKHAQELNLTSPHSIFVPKKGKKKKKNIVELEDEITYMDIFGRDEDELIEFIQENELETNPDDYQKLLGGCDLWKLMCAVARELELIPDWDEIHEMDREELEDLVEELCLEEEIDLEDYDYDEDGDNDLADEIAEYLGANKGLT
jgi:hypothetical protein